MKLPVYFFSYVFIVIDKRSFTWRVTGYMGVTGLEFNPGPGSRLTEWDAF